MTDEYSQIVPDLIREMRRLHRQFIIIMLTGLTVMTAIMTAMIVIFKLFP